MSTVWRLMLHKLLVPELSSELHHDHDLVVQQILGLRVDRLHFDLIVRTTAAMQTVDTLRRLQS